MTPSGVIAVFAVCWELVSSGSLYIIDPRGYRAVYQATWWAPAAALVVAAGIVVATAGSWIEVLAGILSGVSAGMCFRFPFPRAEKRRISDPGPVRRATDSNRRRRIVLLLVSAALIAAESFATRVT